ncbi:hypothetical protein E2C01_000893 [Portunus trituberculatus]|uniref:Uncharacterized protein n=1 Tax=Portunus trituberculatus TaxID=210409 RepID=A0A5B7CFB2_PORTR|nr:hypothetical protein [Portunus trituberculatus]
MITSLSTSVVSEQRVPTCGRDGKEVFRGGAVSGPRRLRRHFLDSNVKPSLSSLKNIGAGVYYVLPFGFWECQEWECRDLTQ